ncbi:MAG: hypothetical protein K2X32_09710 [Phycisphaerales bacterium]|nr:hypothetical protein [Phycisphaerales bacterium]
MSEQKRTISLLPPGADRPGESCALRPHGPRALACRWRSAALTGAWNDLGQLAPDGAPVACWSGTGQSGDDPAGLFDADPRSWGPAALAALTSFVDDRVLPEIARSAGQLWLRPHARHVLCDSVRAERFVVPRATRGLRLLADPTALLTRAMLARADDHYERAMESITRVSAAGALGAVVISNIARATDDEPGGAVIVPPADSLADPEAFTADDGAALRPAALHKGVIDPQHIIAAMARWLDPEAPIVLIDDDADAQLDLLRRGGIPI